MVFPRIWVCVACWYKDANRMGGMETFSTGDGFCPTNGVFARRSSPAKFHPAHLVTGHGRAPCSGRHISGDAIKQSPDVTEEKDEDEE